MTFSQLESYLDSLFGPGVELLCTVYIFLPCRSVQRCSQNKPMIFPARDPSVCLQLSATNLICGGELF